MFIWFGKNASEMEKRLAMKSAQVSITVNFRSSSSAITISMHIKLASLEAIMKHSYWGQNYNIAYVCLARPLAQTVLFFCFERDMQRAWMRQSYVHACCVCMGFVVCSRYIPCVYFLFVFV